MDIILVHLGPQFPSYLFDCVKQIRCVTDDRIILIFSEEYNFSIAEKDVITVYVNNLKKCETWNSFVANHFDGMGTDLWRYACERFYAIETVMKNLSIDKALHIENDNLIYAKPDEPFFETFIGEEIGLTYITETLMGAGVMYVGSLKALNKLNSSLNNLMKMGVSELGEKYGPEMLNEMRLLKITQDEIPGLIKWLPILPHFDSNYVYDCASWGQYVGGTYHTPGIPYHDDSHIIGREINKGNYDVVWKRENGIRYPVVVEKIDKTEKRLFNLHIHSKELKKWGSK